MDKFKLCEPERLMVIMMDASYIEIAKLVNTHGIAGEIKALPLCDAPEQILDFGAVFIDQKVYNIASARVHKQCVLLKFKEINNIEEAVALLNKVAFVNKADFKLPENRFFIKDLMDLEVIDQVSGETYGKIADVISTGARDVYVIEGGERQLLIPAIPEVIKNVDMDNRKIYILPLEGLFDL